MSYQTIITQKQLVHKNNQNMTFRTKGRLKNVFLTSMIYYRKLNRQLKNSKFCILTEN